MKAEYLENEGCRQRDSAEREEYAGAQSIDNWEDEEAGGAELLERVLSRENLNNAFKRVKANKGAPGIDGMTVEDAPGWLREHREEHVKVIGRLPEAGFSHMQLQTKDSYRPDTIAS